MPGIFDPRPEAPAPFAECRYREIEDLGLAVYLAPRRKVGELVTRDGPDPAVASAKIDEPAGDELCAELALESFQCAEERIDGAPRSAFALAVYRNGEKSAVAPVTGGIKVDAVRFPSAEKTVRLLEEELGCPGVERPVRA